MKGSTEFIDVIVEDEEEEDGEEDIFDDDDNNSEMEDGSSEYSEYSEYDDDNVEQEVVEEKPTAPEFKSSNRIRGLLGSVASKLNKSMGNIAGNKNFVSNLKKNLGSQISLKNSTLDLYDS